jgi:hypothetical protein
MPLMQYFLFVGAALLALLFAVSAELPSPPVVKATNTAADLPMIRIHSDRKWPERVVFDTSAKPPTVAPVQTASIAPTPPAPPQQEAEVSTKSTARDAVAQLTPTHVKKREAKPVPKRRLVRNRLTPPTMLAAQRPQFGFFANNIW